MARPGNYATPMPVEGASLLQSYTHNERVMMPFRTLSIWITTPACRRKIYLPGQLNHKKQTMKL